MIKLEIDRQSAAAFKRELDAYQKKKGVVAKDAIRELAGEVALGLASRVQPWGMSVAKQRKFALSIAKQVGRAVKNANISQGSDDARSAHKKRRNTKGQVPKELNTAGQYKRQPISKQERDQLARRKMSSSGQAKASWAGAGLKAFPSLKVAGFFKRLVKACSATVSGNGMNTTVVISNELDYIERTMPQSAIQSGIQIGYRKMFRKLKNRIES